MTSSSPYCFNKRCYADKKSALVAAGNMRRRIYARTGIEEPIQAYHCYSCHSRHIGHPPGWRAANNVPRPVIRTTL